MRQDVISLIESHGDATNAIILTHNIDFVFLQQIVIPALKQCGRPTLTVFADVHCAADTFAYQSAVLSTLGTRYRVVPVDMGPGFRFHPKALLLSGPSKATLLVGSGNLTFGGWRENAEVWIRFDSDSDTTAALAAFRNYLLEILRRIPLSRPVRNEIDEAFDGRSRAWAESMDSPAGLMGRVGSGPSLLQQIAAAAGEIPVQEFIVCSPYFDHEGKALHDLIELLKPDQTKLLIQKKHPGFPSAAVAGLPSGVEFIPVGFTRKNSKGADRESFIHAKFYGITNADRTLVLAGSANCSRAALTISGGSGNAELLALQSVNQDEFNDLYLSEIPRVGGMLDFPTLHEEDQDTAERHIRILAARHDAGLLQIGYSCNKDVELTRCIVDGESMLFSLEDSSLIVVEIARPPARLILEGTWNGQIVRSPEGWVDVERELRSTSRGRSLAGAILDKVQTHRWGIGAWKDVLDVFCKHLQYMPPRSSDFGRSTGQRSARKTADFTADDVFSAGYGLPNLGSAARAGLADDRIQSLQRMLLQWFGIEEHDESPEDNGGEPPGGDDEAEDTVDQPQRIVPRKNKIIVLKPVSELDRKKAKKAVEQMTKAMTSEEFLSQRSPELMAADIKIAAILLRTGFMQHWIDESDFFEATRIIWSSLFFSSSKEPSRGWLEKRYRDAENPDDFIFRIKSPELSAALAAWSMTAPPDITTPEQVVFALANVLSVARLPWLWHGGSPAQISKELESMLVNTGDTLWPEKLKRYENIWVSLMRRGEALRALEEVMSTHTPAELRAEIDVEIVLRGDLLWQGSSGYCVALTSTRRSSKEFTPALSLQSMKKETEFQSDFLIPIRSLLRTPVLLENEKFEQHHEYALRKMLSEISKSFHTST